MTEIHVTNGYTRRRHWEVVYHDLLDLYGPMIGMDGIGLWITYKRYVQNDPEHLLCDRAWPSHRGLECHYSAGRRKIHNARERLERTRLIHVKPGSELSSEVGLTLAQLARVGIQNPAATLFIRVNDPLEFHAFCEEFGYKYEPIQTPSGHWNMAFRKYPGRIMGPNRLLAAAAYIENSIKSVSTTQIRSLLRCNPNDHATVKVRSRLLNQWRAVNGPETQIRHTTLPDNVLRALSRLGWQGSLGIVEEAFLNNADYAWQQIEYWLEHRDEVDRPAAALRKALEYGADEVEYDELEKIDF